MSHFIILRQQIKVIETIKKTTGAMRLISMSMHSRLRNQKPILEAYTNEIKKIDDAVRQEPTRQTEWHHNTRKDQRPIIILIGSQKGLCGGFNDQLFKFLESKLTLNNNDIILTVGKHASDYVKKFIPQHKFLRSYDQFSALNFVKIANLINNHLFDLRDNRTVIFSNIAPTFLSQKPQELVIEPSQSSTHDDPLSAYLHKLKIKSILLHTLYESLLAEQAARFLSMDMAHRNADEILARKRLDYNKTRQAYVTRELIELSGGMVAQE